MSQDYTMIHKTKEIYLKDINSNRASKSPTGKCCQKAAREVSLERAH